MDRGPADPARESRRADRGNCDGRWADGSQMMWNQFRYYQSELKFSWQLVMSLGVGATSVLQWYYWESSHKQAMTRSKQTPTYKNRLKALEYEQLQLVRLIPHAPPRSQDTRVARWFGLKCTWGVRQRVDTAVAVFCRATHTAEAGRWPLSYRPRYDTSHLGVGGAGCGFWPPLIFQLGVTHVLQALGAAGAAAAVSKAKGAKGGGGGEAGAAAISAALFIAEEELTGVLASRGCVKPKPKDVLLVQLCFTPWYAALRVCV